MPLWLDILWYVSSVVSVSAATFLLMQVGPDDEGSVQGEPGEKPGKHKR